jgi:hypothetical protein
MENEEIVRNADISENFTIIGNNIIKDARLSIEARFVLIFMRSFKKGWVFYKTDLQERLNVGRRVLDRCFNELSEVGYLIETEVVEKQGLFASKGYVVYPYSIKDEPITLYSTDVQNVQRREETSITKETADVQNVQRGVLSDVQNVQLINTNINTNKKDIKKFVPPNYEEVKAFFIENQEPLEKLDKCFTYYNDANWTNRDGKKVKDWKRTIKTNWFSKNKNRDGHHNVPPAAPSRKLHESFNFKITNNDI